VSQEDDPVLPFPTPVRAGPVEVTPQRERLVARLEAMLFAVGEPVSSRVLAEALSDVEPAEIERGLTLLQHEYASDTRGLLLHQVGGRWQIRSDERFSDDVLRIRGGRPARLSAAALEVLSIIAYRQPITKMEMEQLRGVDSSGVLKNLLKRGLVRTAGREQIPGRPLLYATSRSFLEMFSLPDLHALPALRELEELAAGEESLNDED